MIVICGKNALVPEKIAKVCRDNHHNEVYALPWVTTGEELRANLKVNRGKPNRLFPCSPNTEEVEGESIEFYDRLKDDAFGTMADALHHGSPVLNETMSCPCENAFYGQVLVPKWVPGAVAILRCGEVDTMFPCEPLSAKLYAMTTVPVLLGNTDAFKEKTGCPEDEIAVLLATDYIPRIVTFMRFYKLFSGNDWVFSVPLEKFPGHLPLRWRYNRAYKVT